MSVEKELTGKKITDVAIGASFVEITLEDGTTWIIESTDKKTTRHQSLVDINVYKEEE